MMDRLCFASCSGGLEMLLNMHGTFTFSGPGLSFFLILLSYTITMNDPNNFASHNRDW